MEGILKHEEMTNAELEQELIADKIYEGQYIVVNGVIYDFDTGECIEEMK